MRAGLPWVREADSFNTNWGKGKVTWIMGEVAFVRPAFRLGMGTTLSRPPFMPVPAKYRMPPETLGVGMLLWGNLPVRQISGDDDRGAGASLIHDTYWGGKLPIPDERSFKVVGNHAMRPLEGIDPLAIGDRGRAGRATGFMAFLNLINREHPTP